MRYGTIFFPDQKIQSYNNTQQKNNNIWTHSSSFVSLYVSSSWVLVFIVIVLFRFTSLECWLWRVGNNSIDFQSQVLLRIDAKCAQRTLFFPHSLVVFVNMTIKYYPEYVLVLYTTQYTKQCTLSHSVINARIVNALLYASSCAI